MSRPTASPGRYVTLRRFIGPTGRWTLTREIGADGEPIARPEMREFAFGSEVEGTIFAPTDLADYLADGIVVPVGSPEATAAIARADAERKRAGP